ncbi:meiosis-specific protein MEI4 [Lepisosteus oculatus]|uniref:meiosis-specific protein MEI4 n=1 Tax=Lepisosteus oculatus TaxID=7918 RepID=UPI0035F51FBA
MNLTGKLKANDDMDRDIEEGASMQTWYRRTAELGLALAIILNKPPEQSGRQYTEYLVTRLQSRDESWKAKAEELQEKVLQLQQELFLTKMLSRPESRGERGESSVEILSQDVLCSTSHEPNPEEDSGCDTGNMGSLPPSQELGDLAVQQASSRREVAFEAWNFESKKVKAVHFHTKFLRNVLGLRRIKELGNATPDPLASDQNYSIIRDSVCQLLDCVSFLYRDCEAVLPSSLLLEAGQAVAGAVEQGTSCEQACTQFVKKMEEFLKEFTSLILENNQLNRFQTQESIADFLILLGRSSLLKSSFVCHLLSQISHFADEVQQACQKCPRLGLQLGLSQDLGWIVEGGAVALWLRICACGWKVAGSNPAAGRGILLRGAPKQGPQPQLL